MRHLFVSCAAVALMAAPALAQATYETTEPLVESEESLDPTQRDPSETATEFETETGTAPVAGTAGETSDDATFAGNAPAEGETTGPVADAEGTDPDAAIAETQSVSGAETAPGTETFASPMTVADLPEDYSTADLNALMLAQLNVVADEIADSNAQSGNNVYASAETEAGTGAEMAMTESAATDQTATEDYASTAPMSGDTAVAPETYAATEPGSSGSETDTTTDETDASRQMADSGSSQSVTAEAYASTQPMSDDTPVAPEAYAAMEPVDPALGVETGSMTDETDDSRQMAGASVGSSVAAEGDADQTAFEIASAEDRFSTLVELVSLAGLEDALGQDGPYTVFAPTNEAFAALPEATLAHLKTEAGKGELVEILQDHVVQGALMSGTVPMAGQSVETIGDASFNVTGSLDGTLNVAGSNTIGEGVVASNGVVYAVDAVILPEAVTTGTEG
ncbi:MAG: fasciclin domain-containing protein [Pannonibacter sp.]